MGRLGSAEWGQRMVDWLHQPIIPVPLAKELRAVLLPWTICWFLPCAALVLCSSAGIAGEVFVAGSFCDIGSVVAGTLYAIGSAILGASIFGAEFTWRTVPLLLAQPVSRRRVWSMKMTVLLTALSSSALAVILCARFLRDCDYGRPSNSLLSPEAVHLLVLAICGAALNGLCLGPWLSMQARSALAGAVFSWALPASLWMGFGVLAIALRSPDQRLFLWIGGLCVLWGAAFVFGYRQFQRLEAADTRAVDVTLPRWVWRGCGHALAPAREAQPGRWLGRLVRKELRLQQVTLYLALLFCGGFPLYALVERGQSEPARSATDLIVLGYSSVIALLAGALTCTEERQFGTLEWHLVLPLPARTQWGVKVGVAMGLSIVLGAVLPLVLLELPLLAVKRQEMPGLATLAGSIALLTSWAIYASSLSTSTLRAVLLALVLAGGYWCVLANSVFMLTRTTVGILSVAVLLWFGFGNFRRIGPRVPRVLGQAAVAATGVGLVYLILAGV